MEFNSSSNVYRFNKEDQGSIGKEIVILNKKPTYENDIGVYKDGEAWVVGHMREKGQIFEVGRYVKEDVARQNALEYKNELEEMFKV